MLTEVLLLSIAAASLGLLLGRWLLGTLAWLQPRPVPIPPDVPLDATVLLFTTFAGVMVALVCGVAPAIRVSRADPSRALQTGSRRTSSTGGRTRDGLVVAEVALSVAILAVSGLLVQSMLALQRVDSGFDSANVLTLQFRLPQTKYSRPADIARFFRQAIERVRSAAGVESAALVRRVPYSGNWGDTPFTIDGRPVAAGAEPRAGQNIVTPDYFRTMKIPLLQGRDFADRDDLQSPPVAVINQTFARTMWPGEDPIGKRIRVPDFKDSVAIVGVVGDVKHRSSTEPRQPQIYLAHYRLPMIAAIICRWPHRYRTRRTSAIVSRLARCAKRRSGCGRSRPRGRRPSSSAATRRGNGPRVRSSSTSRRPSSRSATARAWPSRRRITPRSPSIRTSGWRRSRRPADARRSRRSSRRTPSTARSSSRFHRPIARRRSRTPNTAR